MIDTSKLTVEDLGRTVLWRGGPPDHHVFAILVAIEDGGVRIQWDNGTRTVVGAETLSWTNTKERRDGR
jgi:hypothetical protein